MILGRGRRIQLADGWEWRIKSTTSGRHIVPIIVSKTGTIATSGPLYAKRSYGINGPEYGSRLIPMGRVGIISSGKWELRQHEEQVALIDQSQQAVHADRPIPHRRGHHGLYAGHPWHPRRGRPHAQTRLSVRRRDFSS